MQDGGIETTMALAAELVHIRDRYAVKRSCIHGNVVERMIAALPNHKLIGEIYKDAEQQLCRLADEEFRERHRCRRRSISLLKRIKENEFVSLRWLEVGVGAPPSVFCIGKMVGWW